MQLANTLASRLSKAEANKQSYQNSNGHTTNHMNFETSPIRRKMSFIETNSIVEEEASVVKINGLKKRKLKNRNSKIFDDSD